MTAPAKGQAHIGVLASTGGAGNRIVKGANIGEDVKVYLDGVLTAQTTNPGSASAFMFSLLESPVVDSQLRIPIAANETVTPVVTTTPTITESVNATVIGIYMPLPPETVIVASGLSFAGVADSVTMDLQTTILITLSETIAPIVVGPTITESVTPTLH